MAGSLPEPFYERDGITIYNADAFELLPDLKGESVDLVLTDPPYSSLRRWEGVGSTGRMGLGKKGTAAEDPSKFFPTIANEDLPLLSAELRRVTRAGRHAVIMSDGATLPYMLGPDNLRFWDYWKLCVWDKGTALGMGYHFRGQHEYLFLADKGKNRPPADLGLGDIFRFAPDIPKLVPTQKPLALMGSLVSQLSLAGETVLDPFLGAGTTLVAAANLKRRAIGIEIERAYCEIAVERLRQGGLL